MNPVRKCAICGQVDDHPRHVHTLPDGGDFSIHMDCCANARNCESCTGQLEGVGGVDGNPKGEALREHLQTCGSSPEMAGWTAPADEMKG